VKSTGGAKKRLVRRRSLRTKRGPGKTESKKRKRVKSKGDQGKRKPALQRREKKLRGDSRKVRSFRWARKKGKKG